ncbi:MAG: NAD(P)-binding domain-containing protein [Bacteroidales bacterium]
MEQLIIYGVVALIVLIVFGFYIFKQRRQTATVTQKIQQAKEDGAHEPVSLYPVIDPNRCIKSGACVEACPEKDILGIKAGRATIINASHCIGHGACFRACPMEAISLWIGTEKRGVDLPHLSVNFETNVKGIFIAGELGGMGLIKNAVTQGYEAVEYISKTIVKDAKADYDLIVVGSGPAGISATLAAKKFNLRVLTLEQGTLGGTISNFPRSKVIMTSPMELPLYGKVKLRETSKGQLLDLWQKVMSKHDISVKENSKVESIAQEEGIFHVTTGLGDKFTSKTVLLAIGRRGTPRKLDVPGEETEKVAYRLLEPEVINDKRILVVGGGDSAIESALSLADKNKVILSYRSSAFNRIKKKNAEKINAAMQSGLIDVQFNTNVVSIDEGFVAYKSYESDEIKKWENDMVYIFAGGELPSQFLKNIGIEVSTKRGEAILKHNS